VTLIEAVLYIAVALALIVGGLVFCQQASLSARVNAQICVISRPVSESRALCSSNETLGSLPRITGSSLSQMVNRTGARLEPTLIAAGAVPSSLLHTPTARPVSYSKRIWRLYRHFGRPERGGTGISGSRVIRRSNGGLQPAARGQPA
jgi:ABC-type Co2+ transport system permease subunit